ncbi:MAG: carboxypeptidase-like regulatory domain-containing protein [Planctomycetota bacterium]
MSNPRRLFVLIVVLLLAIAGAWTIFSLVETQESPPLEPTPETPNSSVHPEPAINEPAEDATSDAPATKAEEPPLDDVTRVPLAAEPAPPVTLGEGRVLDGSGQPVAGATIHIIPAADEERASFLEGDPEDWFATGLEVTSDEEGRFALTVQRHDIAHAVIARKPGFGWDFVPLDAQVQDQQQPLLLHLEPTCRLRGRVVDQDGEPISKARVRHHWSYQWESSGEWPTAKALYAELTCEEVTTDGEGRFEFCEVRREDQDVQASAPGRATATLVYVDPNAEVKLTLVPAAVIYGTVTDRLGRPVPGARVRTYAYGCMPEVTTPWVPCNEDGSYTIDGAFSGSIGVSAWTDQEFASYRVNLWVEAGERAQVDFVLHPETTIDGRLVDSKDAGVPNVRLFILAHRTGLVSAELNTDEQGYFTARNIAPGETYWMFVPATDDYGPRYIEGIPAGSKDVTIRMLEAGRIWGKLTFDGEPTRNVRVRLLPRRHLGEDEGLMFMVVQMHDGASVPLDDIEEKSYSYRAWAGVYDIEFRAESYSPVIARNVTVPPGKSALPLDIHFSLPETLSGVVLDGATGTPVAGAKVQVLEEYYTGTWKRSSEPFAATTDAAGHFTLPAVPHGTTELCVVASGYAENTVRDLSARAAGEELVIKLMKGGRIEGRVETSYSDPSGSVWVVVRELGREDGQLHFVDQKGRFAFEHVPSGRVEVVLYDGAYQSYYPRVGPQIRQVEVREGETAQVDFDAATGVTLRGRVVGWDKPLLLEARLLGGEGEGAAAGAAYSDREGAFRIPHLRPGRYRVASTMGQPGYSIAVSGEVTISSQEPDELVLHVPGNTLQGIVQDGTGNVIPRAIVTVEKDRAPSPLLAMCLTDGEGKFAIGGLEDGHYALRARARGHAMELIEAWQVPSDLLTIRLATEARLLLRVTDDTGIPLPGARVGARHTTRPMLSRAALCGPEGTAEFSGLQAHPHEVAATLSGYVPADPLIVPLREGETRQVTLVLMRAGELEVIVQDKDGKPLEKIPVFLADEERRPIGQRMTDENGRALFLELAPGWYEVAADTDSNVTDAAEVVAGERATVELVIVEDR